ncbi:MAG TPA: FHA domain-containing protein [Roseiflexaceae bacterium]|nr:FHA domain-containing protein [Roseiflexaceae bacterium]
MSARPTIEKEIAESQKRITAMEKEIRELRDYINNNERGLGRMSDTLQKITQESITRARADLAHREIEAQRVRDELTQNQRILGKMEEVARKEQEIARLEQEQERIIALLEQHRADLLIVRGEYEKLVNPVVAPACELVLPDNRRIALDPNKGEYVLGSQDADTRSVPDIDLMMFGGLNSGISRRHTSLRYEGGAWLVSDLGSTNGTFVNDRQLPAHSPFVLQDKSVIRLGNSDPAVQLFFRYVTKTRRLG